MRTPAKLALAGTGGVLAAALWWRANPSACPYGQRFWVEAPHPLITRPRLQAILEPRPGEHVLEVGPGTGYYAVPMAEWLGEQGTLELFDLQRKMLDHTAARIGERSVAARVIATQGDARELPYPDASFDAAYLTAVLGEIPDQDAALRELARVLRPGGRLVVGELFGDPHYVRFGKLGERAGRAGLRFERRVGGRLGYFARFAPVLGPEAVGVSAAT